MTPAFTICHATFRRPEKAVAAMELFRKRADRPRLVEYLFSTNADDDTATKLVELVAAAYDDKAPLWGVRMVTGAFKGSAEAWNEAAKGSNGHVLIQGQDDIEPPEHWDTLLAQKLDGKNARSVVAVSDGYRKDELLCTAVCTRDFAAMRGHFLDPAFISVFSDDDFTIQAIAYAAEGKADLIDARSEITFLHRHHYHDKSVPWDETYARENDAHAYAVGQKLFAEKNARWIGRGFKRW